MPGGRTITGADLQAALRAFGPPGADADALRAAVPDGAVVAGYDELVRRCPPERMGMSSGAHAALFAPLFGEFE